MNLKLTPSGTNLLRRTIAGEAQINFALIQLGNGADAGENAIALSNPLMTVEISNCTVDGIFVTLTAIFSNNEVTAGFRATELGVFVNDPDSAGDTMLYAYGYTTESKADYIPTSADRVLESQMDVLVYIGDAQNVTASISQSLVYAAKADFEAHLADNSNPHHVTKDQIGLGNVQNMGINDLRPSWVEPQSPAILTSAEKMGTLMGKIAASVRVLISHLADGVRHITDAERTAWNSKANASHLHSTANITSGTLGVARGGTGCTTLKEAANTIVPFFFAPTMINPGTNLNGYTDPGFFYVAQGAINNPPGAPNTAGMLLVYQHSTNSIGQLFISCGTGTNGEQKIWFRLKIDSAWGAWT